jgi:predicted amidophosphoribosyltransferase
MSRPKRCWQCHRELNKNEQLRKIMGQMICPKCVKEMSKGAR